MAALAASLTALPYWASGVAAGLASAYANVLVAPAFEALPGVRWLGPVLRSFAPAPPEASREPRRGTPGSLQDQEQQGGQPATAPAALDGPQDEGLPAPHPSFQDVGRLFKPSAAGCPPAAAPGGAGAQGDSRRLLLEVQDRLTSFPVDSLSSPSDTTATAPSQGATAAPSPEGGAGGAFAGAGAGGASALAPAAGGLGAPLACMEVAAGLEELGCVEAASSGEPAAAEAAAATPEAAGPPAELPDSPTKKAQRLKGDGGKSPGGAALRSDQQARGSGAAAATSGGVQPLTDKAVAQLNLLHSRQQQQQRPAPHYAGAAGSSRAAYAIGLPASRILRTSSSSPSRSSGGGGGSSNPSSGDNSPLKPPAAAQAQAQARAQARPTLQRSLALAKEPQPPAADAAAAPAAGAGGRLAAVANKLHLHLPSVLAPQAQAADGPCGSPHSVSSIHTADSAATVERKHRHQQMLSALKQKAGSRGRQQIR